MPSRGITCRAMVYRGRFTIWHFNARHALLCVCRTVSLPQLPKTHTPPTQSPCTMPPPPTRARYEATHTPANPQQRRARFCFIISPKTMCTVFMFYYTPNSCVHYYVLLYPPKPCALLCVIILCALLCLLYPQQPLHCYGLLYYYIIVSLRAP